MQLDNYYLIGIILAATIISFGAGWLIRSSMLNRRLRHLLRTISDIRAGVAVPPPPGGSGAAAQIDSALYSFDKPVTDLRQSLESSDRKTRILVETMPIGIMITDGGGNILTTNPQAQELLGMSAAELASYSIREIFADLQDEALFSHEKTNMSFESCLSRGEDDRVFVEVSIKEFGRRDTWLVSFIDISERKKIERLKQEFTEMITHDLRAPLTSIQLYLEMLICGRYGPLPEAALMRARAAEDSCQRLVDLINSLLEIERLASGSIELALDLTEVASIFERSVQALEGLIESRKLVLSVEGTDLELICDEERLMQVLINLLSNAIKYSPDGGRLLLSAETKGSVIRFCVADDGPGIPAEFRESIFERFYQVPGQAKQGSSGLGLAICREIVSAHGGQIGVESNNGRGSKFWFTIPSKPGSWQ